MRKSVFKAAQPPKPKPPPPRPPVSLESSLYDSFLQGLRELGYVEGCDFVVEWRFAEGRNEIIPALAAELVRSNADVIVLTTSTAVRPTQELTKTIPIIMGIS